MKESDRRQQKRKIYMSTIMIDRLKKILNLKYL